MATRNSAMIIDAKLAASYYAAPKTKQKQALAAFRRALQESKPIKRKALRPAQEETGLLLRINHNLTSAEQARYDELTAQRLDGKLTKQGDAELGALVSKIERIWADRLEAIAELARLRKVSPQTIMKQLKIDPRVTAS